jgi:hypothetical protein
VAARQGVVGAGLLVPGVQPLGPEQRTGNATAQGCGRDVQSNKLICTGWI